MEPQKRSRRAMVACAVVIAVWAAIAFFVFSPDASCGDCNVKYVQAQSLLRSGFRSMTLAYPGAVFDSDWKFLPFKPPFTVDALGGTQGVWASAVIIVQTPFVAAADLGGLVVLSIISGALVLWMTVRLGGRADDWVLPIALGFGTCLWYYAVLPWEHAPGVAAVMCALWLATRTRKYAVLAAGLLMGAAAVLRDDTLVLVPTLLLVLWFTHRRVRALLVACAAVAAVIAAAGMLDYFGYGRPPAVHLMHAVSVLRLAVLRVVPSRALVATAAPVPTLSFAERYDVVVHYWLTSSLSHLTVLAYVGGVAAAAALVRWGRSSAGVLVMALVMIAWSGHELWMRALAPRSIPSLFPLSPFIVFALFPAPDMPADTRRMRHLLLAGSLICIGFAILTTDTTGGKSFGPRMLLGLMPLLSIAAWTGIDAYRRAGRRGHAMHRAIGWAGAALIAISVGMNAVALLPWAGRIAADHQAQQAVLSSPVPIVVADDSYTAQAFMPLYFKKVLVMAERQWVARQLGEALARARVGVVLVVTRNGTPSVSIERYRCMSSETVGRITLQQWVRGSD